MMADYKTLVERLRGRADYCELRGETTTPELLREAANELELYRARAENIAMVLSTAPYETNDNR